MTIDDVKLSEEGRFLPWGKVAAEKLQKVEDWIAGGGGNPNRVQTITGTLAEPWGGHQYSISNALYSNECSAVMHGDATAIGESEFDLILETDCDGIKGSYVFMSSNECVAASIVWAESLDYSINEALICNASTSDETVEISDIKEYGSLIPTTLTIIWHPLPESE